MAGRRWDGDERGEGIADARSFVAGAEVLVEAMRTRNWVAEEPEMHLLPHVQRYCESLPFELIDARVSEDGSFDVDLRWIGETRRIGEVRAAIFALVGSFAEVATYVRQRRSAQMEDGDTTSDFAVFEIVTGSPEEESFTPHGHTVRLRVTDTR
jgi:hypothetical protein